MSKEMELAFEEKIVAYEKETSMPHITSAERIGIEKGIEKGLQKGIEEGLQKGQTSLIVRMLKRRWGAMYPELEVRLSRLSLAQLESLGETLMDFRDPSDLRRWLDDNAN